MNAPALCSRGAKNRFATTPVGAAIVSAILRYSVLGLNAAAENKNALIATELNTDHQNTRRFCALDSEFPIDFGL